MKKKRLLRRALAATMCAATLMSCMNDVDLSNVNTDIALPEALALPVGRARMDLKELLGKMPIDSMLVMDENGRDINVVVNEEMAYTFNSISLSEQIPDFTVTYDFADYAEFNRPEVPDRLPLPPGQKVGGFQKFDYFDLGLQQNEDEMITSARIRELVFLARIEHDIEDLRPENIKVKVEFADDKVKYADGRHEVVKDSIDGSVEGRFVFSDIAIYPLAVERDSMLIKLSFEINTGTTGVTLERTDEFRVNFSVEKLDWTEAWGHFPVMKLDEQAGRIDGFDIDFLKGLKLYNPQVNINVRTNAGIPFDFNLNYLKSCRVDGQGNVIPGTTEQADFDGSPSKTIRMEHYSKQPGTWSDWNIVTFDRNNGGIHRFFANDSVPNVLEYSYAVQSPEASSDEEYFITPEAGIEVGVEAVIPLYLDSSDKDNVISISDTITSLELDSLLPDGIKLEKAFLGLRVENGLPVGVDFSLAEFLDKDDRPVEVSINSPLFSLPMPPVDNDGLLPEGGKVEATPCNIEITDEVYGQLKKVNKIRYLVEVKQEAGKKVRFVQDNYFGVQIGIYVKAKMDTSIFGEE